MKSESAKDLNRLSGPSRSPDPDSNGDGDSSTALIMALSANWRLDVVSQGS